MCDEVKQGQCLSAALSLYVSSRLYCKDTMKTRACLALSDEPGFGVRLPMMTTASVCACVGLCALARHQGLQFPPLSRMPLLRAAGGGG